MKANYHTHTHRCKHALGEDREYVEQAIMSGMKVLGFSDHCPWVYENDYVSGMRMQPSELDDYFASLLALKEEYAQDISIYIGFESEYIPELIEKQDQLLADYPVDYMILGQHFNEPEYDSDYNGIGTYNLEQFVRYIDLIIEGMSSGRYKYVAHPDLLYYAGDESVRVEQYTRLCRFMKEHDFPIEINLVGLKSGAHYPSDRLLKIAHEVGNTAIIGVDAHRPEVLGDTASMELCEIVAQNYGIELVEHLPGLI